MSGIIKPGKSFKNLVDASKKHFEGEIETKLYSNRIISKGYCWHCRSKVYIELELSPDEAKASEQDEVFRNNLIELERDRIVERHQCGLFFEGMAIAEEVGARLQGNA